MLARAKGNVVQCGMGEVAMPSERGAQRIVDAINGAYRAGVEDAKADMRKTLEPQWYSECMGMGTCQG